MVTANPTIIVSPGRAPEVETEVLRYQIAGERLRTFVAADAARNGPITSAEIDVIAAETDALPRRS